ncbi:MAG: hypothetical protein ACLPKB_20525 [Xanthobacteraceae bacterium]
MPRLNPAEKKATLLKKQEQIAEQLKQLNAREKENERKADTRRKVIAGALALEHFAQHPSGEFARVLFKLLNDHVDERARHLFAFLPARDAPQTAGLAADESPTPPAATSMAAAARAATVPR